MFTSLRLPMARLVAVALLAMSVVTELVRAEGEVAMEEGQEAHGEEVEPFIAILFPWFAQILGVLAFFFLSRTIFHVFPYTASMFLMGVIMGVGITSLDNTNQLNESIEMWASINSEVLLLVFLPGLIFKDAFGMDVHLFAAAIWQLITLAFPMVLAGTSLTALVGYFVFPYSWSWNLSMTFGAILAATDPVAVSALLQEVGAPPRLKTHISGESLLNDGSAYVFFVIFSALFLTELGIPGIGEDIGVGQGFALFFRLALGGAAIGFAFGLGLVFVLYLLNRRLNEEEGVIQIAATISFAYLTYYTGDIARTSGLIATVVCGVTAKGLGNSMINNHQMMSSFWILVEHLLNTLLFALAGVLWGATVSNALEDDVFLAKDWGYLILLYVLLNAIRFVLNISFYPLISNIGLKSSWQESVFMSYAGLRGAVGIALAISLDSAVREAGEVTGVNVEASQFQTTQLYAMVGGVAFFTLIVNGTFAAPLLKKLGLTSSSKTRTKLLHDFEQTSQIKLQDAFIQLLSDPRFHNVDFAVVKSHVTDLEKMTLDDLKQAVLRNKDYTPNLEHVLPYFLKDGENKDVDLSWAVISPNEEKKTSRRRRSSIWDAPDGVIAKTKDTTDMNAIELRKFFLELLRSNYNRQVEDGELDGRDGFVTYALLNSVDFALDEVGKGKPLEDWKTTEMLGNTTVKDTAKAWYASVSIDKCFGKRVGDDRAYTKEYQVLRVDVYRALGFIEGHRAAQEYFLGELDTAADEEFDKAEVQVVKESDAQVELASKVLENTDKTDLGVIVSHAFCSILLNRTAHYAEELQRQGILTEREVTAYLEEIEEALKFTHHCSHDEHPSQLPLDVKEKSFADVQNNMQKDSKPVANVVEEQPAHAVGKGVDQSFKA